MVYEYATQLNIKREVVEPSDWLNAARMMMPMSIKGVLYSLVLFFKKWAFGAQGMAEYGVWAEGKGWHFGIFKL